MIDAQTLANFRRLLISYFDQQREDWSENLVDSLRFDIIEFVRANASCHDELEQALSFLLVDAESGFDDLLASLRRELPTPALHEALHEYGRRFPRRQREGYVNHLLRATDRGSDECCEPGFSQ